jgi:hypothetical protein
MGNVTLVFAAWYLALHSFAVRAPADDVAAVRPPALLARAGEVFE